MITFEDLKPGIWLKQKIFGKVVILYAEEVKGSPYVYVQYLSVPSMCISSLIRLKITSLSDNTSLYEPNKFEIKFLDPILRNFKK